MSLYAVDEDDLIHAADAERGKIYWCLDCFAPVKMRKGRKAFPHFYHLKEAPTCRLYSKTEDHLLAQLQLQKLFPKGEVELEKPFPKILRIADACWEKEKIIFEIQCSPITEKEAEKRITDYRTIGYETVWLLDDKRYNKRLARPAEEYLRRNSAYYISITQGLFSRYYDQLEVFSAGKRTKKGKQLPIHLQKIFSKPAALPFAELLPKQIYSLESHIYFSGDRLDSALRKPTHLFRWKNYELQAIENVRKPSKFNLLLERFLKKPYIYFLEFLFRSLNRK